MVLFMPLSFPMPCSTQQHTALYDTTLQYSTLHYSTLLLLNIALYYTVHCTILHCTTLYYTTLQHWTVNPSLLIAPLASPITTFSPPSSSSPQRGSDPLQVANVGVLWLLVDGEVRASVPYGTARDAECAQLPDVKACPNIGFDLDFDTRVLTNGAHTLGVRVTGKTRLAIDLPGPSGGFDVR